MKRIATLLAMLGLMVDVYAQGALLRPFGSSYQEVRTSLQAQKMGHLDASSGDLLVVSTGDYEVQHRFRSDVLYKTEVVRYYKNRKDIENAMVSLRDNYHGKGGEVMDLNTAKDQAVFVVRMGGELHEISQVRLGNKGYQLLQVRLDLDGCSNEEYEALKRDELLTGLLKD